MSSLKKKKAFSFISFSRHLATDPDVSTGRIHLHPLPSVRGLHFRPCKISTDPKKQQKQQPKKREKKRARWKLFPQSRRPPLSAGAANQPCSEKASNSTANASNADSRRNRHPTAPPQAPIRRPIPSPATPIQLTPPSPYLGGTQIPKPPEKAPQAAKIEAFWFLEVGHGGRVVRRRAMGEGRGWRPAKIGMGEWENGRWGCCWGGGEVGEGAREGGIKQVWGLQSRNKIVWFGFWRWWGGQTKTKAELALGLK